MESDGDLYSYLYRVTVNSDSGVEHEHGQTCAPHENAFSILRINFRILQSFSLVIFLVAPPIAKIGLKKNNNNK